MGDFFLCKCGTVGVYILYTIISFYFYLYFLWVLQMLGNIYNGYATLPKKYSGYVNFFKRNVSL